MVGEEDEVDIGGDREDALVVGQEPELPAASMLVLSSEQTISAKECLAEAPHLSRKEKRKRLKKLRRKQLRQQAAENEKLEENARLDDSAEQLKIQLEGQVEAERLAAEKANHDEQERLWLEREKKAMEDFQRQQEEIRKLEEDKKLDDVDDDMGYVDDDGPAEIIWKGNEIIVRKRRVKSVAEPPASAALKDENKSTSNPLPPQSTAFAARSKYPQNPDVSEQSPMFGTEQDKTHCPFHIKTGVCRFGVRCSRVHVYPDQSFTLLMRNMYTGPGLTWENDEGLENSVEQHFKEDGKRFRWLDEAKRATNVHSDEEVAQHFEEFYEDVHSEFLQFGELINFKVCKNGSSHLRGNVYVHYKTETGAQAAYSAMNGRYYAGKQITCEFVGVTRWRVALCGEYMKGHHRPCSHGTACNFLHCFRNPQGEYDWADWDGAPPRYWATKMAKFFGYENDQEQEDDDEFKDEIWRHGGSAGSPQQREPQRKESRSRDRHRHSTRDDFEYAARHRERRRHENRDDCYHSDYEESERSSMGRSRDAHHLSSSKDVDERFRVNGNNSIQGFHSIADEAFAYDFHELKGDKRQKRYERHKTGSCDVDGQYAHEVIHGSRRRQNRSGSHNHSLKNTDKDGKRVIKRHRSRDLKDCDKRQELDLRSSRGRHRSRSTETENPIGLETEYAARKYYSKEADNSPVHRRTGNIKNLESFEDRGSSESDVNRSHKRRRNYCHKLGEAEGSIRRKSRNLEHQNEMEEKKALVIDDRWTGDTDSYVSH